MSPRSPTGSRTGSRGSPTEMTSSSGSDWRTSSHRESLPGTRSTAVSSTAADSTSPSSRTRWPGWPRRAGLLEPRPRRRGCSTERRGARSTRRSTWRPVAARRGRVRRPGPLAWGLARARRAWGARPRADPAVRIEEAAARSSGRAAGGSLRARRAVLATGAYRALVTAIRRRIVPVYDYVLVSEPLDASRSAGDRLAPPPGRQRRRQPVPLLPSDRGRPDPLGRVRRGLSLPRRGRRAPRAARADVRPAGAALLPAFPQLEGCGSATAGAARSTPAAASSPSTAPRWGPGRVRSRPHRARRRREPLRRPRRPRPARRAETEPRLGRSEREPCRSRPSRRAGRHPAHPRRARRGRRDSGRRGAWLRPGPARLGYDS